MLRSPFVLAAAVKTWKKDLAPESDEHKHEKTLLYKFKC